MDTVTYSTLDDMIVCQDVSIVGYNDAGPDSAGSARHEPLPDATVTPFVFIASSPAHLNSGLNIDDSGSHFTSNLPEETTGIKPLQIIHIDRALGTSLNILPP